MALIITFVSKTKALAAEMNANFAAILALNVYNEDFTPLTDGIAVTFSTAAIFKAGTLRVYRSGLRLRKGVTEDYIEVLDINGDGTGFTLALTPPLNTPLLADYQKANV